MASFKVGKFSKWIPSRIKHKTVKKHSEGQSTPLGVKELQIKAWECYNSLL